MHRAAAMLLLLKGNAKRFVEFHRPDRIKRADDDQFEA
jgi:hypothetical protein